MRGVNNFMKPGIALSKVLGRDIGSVSGDEVRPSPEVWTVNF
jgi:hypothetical protein